MEISCILLGTSSYTPVWQQGCWCN